MTCPGQNYLVGDILSFAFAGGGTTNPAATFNYTLKAGDLAPNTVGRADQDWDRACWNWMASLGVPVTVTGGVLDGSGSISGPVTVQAGGTLGAGTSTAIGQLNLASGPRVVGHRSPCGSIRPAVR